MQQIRPKKGGKWPTNIQFIFYAAKVHGNGSDIWWAIWKVWCHIRQGLIFQQPDGKEANARQPIFWNKELAENQNTMLGESAHANGCTWMRQGIKSLKDLWDKATCSWKSDE